MVRKEGGKEGGWKEERSRKGGRPGDGLRGRNKERGKEERRMR